MGAREDAGKEEELQNGREGAVCLAVHDVLCSRVAISKCTSFMVRQLVVGVLVPSQTYPFAFAWVVNALDCGISAFRQAFFFETESRTLLIQTRGP